MEIHGEIRDDHERGVRGGRALAHGAHEARVPLGLLGCQPARGVLQQDQHADAGLGRQGLRALPRDGGIVEAGPGQVERVADVGEIGEAAP